jgi:hypothetical protein
MPYATCNERDWYVRRALTPTDSHYAQGSGIQGSGIQQSQFVTVRVTHAERMREMNVLRIFKQTFSPTAMLVAMIVAITPGCKDLTSQDNATALDAITNEIPDSSEPAELSAASEPAESTAASNRAQPRAESSLALPEPDASNPDTSNSDTSNSDTSNSDTPNSDTPNSGTTNQVARKRAVAIPAVKPNDVYEPRVILSRAHEQTCLVNVADTLPNLALTHLTGELKGESVALDDLRGDQLTVVVFWTTRLAFGREQFAHLASEVALPFRHLGVKVVAVNVGDPVEQIELDDVTKDEIVCVHDSDGTAIATIATSKLPRTYLIDGQGRILWFDLEYSRTTRRQLKNAIFYHSRD